MARAVPEGRLAVIPKAGHLSAIEQPEAFNAEIVGFLNAIHGEETRPRA